MIDTITREIFHEVWNIIRETGILKMIRIIPSSRRSLSNGIQQHFIFVPFLPCGNACLLYHPSKVEKRGHIYT